MAQDTTKVVMAGTLSSAKEVSCHDVDPADFPAGSCVSMASTGLPSLLKSAGMRIGVSRGRSLSDHKKTDVLRTGLRVPVLAHLKRASGTVTITNIANLVAGTDDTITVGATAFTATDGAVTPGQATFDARTGTSNAATSLAAQINAHATANTLVFAIASGSVVSIYAQDEGEAGNESIALTYEQLGTGDGATIAGVVDDELAGGSDDPADIDYATVGAKMYINDTTGKADVAHNASTVSDAVYVDGPKTGIAEDASEVAAVVVDMQGGL
jgi:hypothetical protein